MHATFDLDTLPEPIRRAVGGRRLERVGLGESGADVFRCVARGQSTLYLKTQRTGVGPPLRAERDRLEWVAGRFPAPEIVAWMETDAREILLLSEVRGVPASDFVSGHDAMRIARLVGEALRHVHTISADECPFDAGIDAMLAAARRNIDRHWVIEDDFDDGRLGRSAEAVLAEALDTRPADGTGVFIHGDPYPQNVLIDGDAVSGLIDWGSAGVGDRWRDLSLATILFEERAGLAVAAELLTAYGADTVDAERCRWWRLMDELC